jgi:hypothetical protein
MGWVLFTASPTFTTASPKAQESCDHRERRAPGILPNVTALRLRAGECMIRDGKNIHRGHSQRTGERLTLGEYAMP